MPALVVGGVTIPVALGAFSEAEPHEVGERVRAFDGTLRNTVRARKGRWRGSTRLLEAADFSLVRSALEDDSATCSGDLLGDTFTCAPKITGGSRVRAGGEIRGTIDFELEET